MEIQAIGATGAAAPAANHHCVSRERFRQNGLLAASLKCSYRRGGEPLSFGEAALGQQRLSARLVDLGD